MESDPLSVHTLAAVDFLRRAWPGKAISITFDNRPVVTSSSS
jgi:hypothetical protein